MNIGIDLPDEIARELEQAWHDLPRRSLEAIAAEAYRSGALGRAQIGELLGFDFWLTESVLKEHLGHLEYDRADLAGDRKAGNRTSK
jgi:hypothetical protein